MAEGDFGRNLALLCGYHPSISEVCRRLGINRQQFNKYLHGPTLPSRRNLRRLCDFFGVEEAEMLLPHRRFAEIVALRPRLQRPAARRARHLDHVERLVARGTAGLEAYEGYYFRYFYSYGFAGKIVKSLLSLQPGEGAHYTKNLGVLRLDPEGRRRAVRFRYLGLPLLINDRIYLLEYETGLADVISQTILYPAFRHRVDLLSGIQLTLAGTRAREPAAGRVVLEYLGRRLDLRRALGACGLFAPDDRAVDPAIRARIDNRVEPDRRVLLADPG